jgi:hypothetical protein
MKPAIQCRYSCVECQVKDAVVTVPARGTEDVSFWLKKICAPAIYKDHARRSPECKAGKMPELKIPIREGSARVGE